MQFETWSDFLAMGGYGFFVWISFGVTFLSMTVLVLQTALEKRQLQRNIVASEQRKARIKAATEGQE